MYLREILNSKGSVVYSIGSAAMMSEAVEKLMFHGIGSLMVVDANKAVGIITERDILRMCNQRSPALDHTRVCDAMTHDFVCGSPDDSIEETMGLMTKKRIRHLPIMDSHDRLVGMISIGDVVKSQHNTLAMENHQLKSYLHS